MYDLAIRGALARDVADCATGERRTGGSAPSARRAAHASGPAGRARRVRQRRQSVRRRRLHQVGQGSGQLLDRFLTAQAEEKSSP